MNFRNEPYKLHHFDACIFGFDNKILVNGGTAHKPSRIEAEKIRLLLNTFANISFEELNTAINHLEILRKQCNNGSDLQKSVTESICILTRFEDIDQELTQFSNLIEKDNIEKQVITRLKKLLPVVPKNYEDIVQYVFEYLLSLPSFPNYDIDEIDIALLEWIESK